MKFGKNLAHLSIPEWKDYNLNYNDLKKHIREATLAESSDLRGLRRKFVENFEDLDLFISTKLGELARKLKADAREFARIKASNELVVAKLESLDSLHYKFINEVSIDLRKLNKFILVQKIAVKKIFKKFLKHYPDQTVGSQFIASLSKTIHSNKASFMNFDSLQLTASLLYLFADVDQELQLLHELLRKKPQVVRPGQIKKNTSASSMGSLRTSLFSCASAPEDVNLDVNFDLEISLTARFDLVAALKKNFSVHSLIPRDVASKNDVSLSLDVYLNIPKVTDTSKVSVVYFTRGSRDDSPSWVLSYEDSPVSAVAVYTGGLRKYSYCCLPNLVVNSVLSLCNSKSDVQKHRFATNIDAYLLDDTLLQMTKAAVTALLQSDAVPSLRLVMDRTRYFVPKGATPQGNSVPGQSDHLSVSPASIGYQSVAHSVDDSRVYEDNFYMALDEQMYTSCHVLDAISFDETGMDVFPFNTFSIYSNDSNLHNFEASLTTEILNSILQSKYRAITLKKLPGKIQNLLQTTSVHLYKNFRLFDYMRSCYFNVIPPEPNNHYTRVLNVNLLKSYENIERSNNQHDVDGLIIQDKSRVILNRQMSYKSMHEAHTGHHETPHKVHEDLLAQTTNKLLDLDHYDDSNNDDTYIAYLSLSTDLEDNFLNNVVLSFIRFMYRTKNILRYVDNTPSKTPQYEPFKPYNLPIPQNPYNPYQSLVAPDHNCHYDSINEDATFLDKTNDFQAQLVHDYDYVLSLLYFSLCFSSIFISGINIGILYSLFDMVDEATQFNLMDNFLVIVLLALGFLSSLVFTMTSINLNFQRFEPSPPSHSGVIWAGFVLVILTVVWSIICIVP